MTSGASRLRRWQQMSVLSNGSQFNSSSSSSSHHRRPPVPFAHPSSPSALQQQELALMAGQACWLVAWCLLADIKRQLPVPLRHHWMRPPAAAAAAVAAGASRPNTTSSASLSHHVYASSIECCDATAMILGRKCFYAFLTLFKRYSQKFSTCLVRFPARLIYDLWGLLFFFWSRPTR